MLVKSLGVAGGLAGVTATGGGIYYLTSSNPATKEDTSNKKPESTQLPPVTKTIEKNQIISSLLKGKRLLTENSEDNGKWAAPWDLFKKAYPAETPKAPWKFENWTQDKDKSDTINSFKTQCLALGKQKVSGESDETYIAVEAYCTTTTGDV
ncbi:hypothetical protein A6V39_03510 [Candidatus Mycoplasma haematobovis]|uniref:Uncharacterized protein n=1 Tax=Candidatus Mycoplasma haematobovis TaxID=432608 RepID=A0A1A9QBX1_9MOLU|nr:hypothetical protein A6V39_03510 [Candidatus Mycoplasma haematobovis]